jgi:hypothetical protein
MDGIVYNEHKLIWLLFLEAVKPTVEGALMRQEPFCYIIPW